MLCSVLEKASVVRGTLAAARPQVYLSLFLYQLCKDLRMTGETPFCRKDLWGQA